ncbi:MAG: GxxExxY protein [Acidobacteriota bacterium]
MAELVHKELSYRIIGACFEVYKQKGCGFTEPVYQECLGIEFSLQKIPFVAQPELRLEYKGTPLTQYFKPDFICFDRILIEIKALQNLLDVHRSQALNYLNATHFDLVLLVNFGHHPLVEYERIVNTRSKSISDELRSWNDHLE